MIYPPNTKYVIDRNRRHPRIYYNDARYLHDPKRWNINVEESEDES